MARKAIAQVHETVYTLLRDKLSEEKAREVTRALSGGRWTHDYPITAKERERLLWLEEKLHERVVGQEETLPAAVQGSRAGLKEGHRPVATFRFLEPTGVGKTELAKTPAWSVFGDEEATVHEFQGHPVRLRARGRSRSPLEYETANYHLTGHGNAGRSSPR